jgi:hypothetical protein
VAFGWQISFDASKEFVDSQGITQMQVIPRRTILLEPTVRSYTINELSPFTTYSVNVSAIPSDRQYRPPTKIAVTTQMAGTYNKNTRSYTRPAKSCSHTHTHRSRTPFLLMRVLLRPAVRDAHLNSPS